MPLYKINPTKTKAWKELIQQRDILFKKKLNDLFLEENNRLKYLSIEWDCFDVDFSKNILNKKTFKLLTDLAKECKITDSIKMLFDGDKINETEERSVFHTELRNFSTKNSFIKQAKKVVCTRASSLHVQKSHVTYHCNDRHKLIDDRLTEGNIFVQTNSHSSCR